VRCLRNRRLKRRLEIELTANTPADRRDEPLPLERLGEAHELMDQGRVIGKVIVKPDA